MEKEKSTISEEIQGTITEIIEQIKKLIEEGNARRVIVKNKKGRILFQSQLTIGAAGATFFVLYAPIFTAIATIVMIASDVVVIVERDETDDDLNDEYEVEADVIEIKDDKDDDKSSENKKDSDDTHDADDSESKNESTGDS